MMPHMEKDAHSGAIIFHLTKDEQSVKDLKDELEDMKSDMSKQLAKLSLLIKEQEKKGGSK